MAEEQAESLMRIEDFLMVVGVKVTNIDIMGKAGKMTEWS